ncbi:DUF4143 domain-containing protein [Gemmatimonas sp.]|uniref:DUF4143 domain-containing protein n=1 Tax=Gemmatimonas sp. TaxID=1962908 RepID=UPI0039836440
MDLFTDLLLVRRRPRGSGNLGKRLVRAPKLYVRDSGVLHALLAIESLDHLLSHPVVGARWEGFVIEQLIAAASHDRLPLYFWTEKGAEVDLLFERGGRVEMLIEIKRTSAPTVSGGLRSAAADLDAAAIHGVHGVHGGSESWPMGGGITATSLAGLAEHLSATARSCHPHEPGSTASRLSRNFAS